MNPHANPGPAVPALSGLMGDLAQGLRMWLFLRPQTDFMRFSLGRLLAFAAVGVLLLLSVQIAFFGTDGSFDPAALPGTAFFFYLPIATAWVLARLAGEDDSAFDLAIALFALAVPFLALDFLSQAAIQRFDVESDELPWVASSLAPAWLAMAAAVVACRRLALTRRSRILAFSASVCLLYLPWIGIHPDIEIWKPRQDADSAATYERIYAALSSEDNFYRQPQLLERAVAAIRPGRAGEVELYFVGVAGYASQDVFMKELVSVERMFAERFGTRGRSITLVNNVETVDTLPVASATALRRALLQVAGKMNREEDILFLFMTSHGTRDHKFSMEFGAMRFKEVDPASLRALLDESGIKRRVVVVSACYSGGFVDVLKNDDTLVIAAAAPDRNSFGCSNENEFTYFGKAYFDEALHETYSFVEAFEIAKPRIAEREKREEYTPSDPRMAVGKRIAPVLDAFAERRRREANRRTPVA